MYFATKEPSAIKAVRSAEVRSPNPEQGRFIVLLEDCTDVTALGDSDSDHSAVSSETWDKLQMDVPSVKFRTFAKPMKLYKDIVGAGVNILFTASRDMNLPITIILPGSQLSVRILGVRCLIIDQAMY